VHGPLIEQRQHRETYVTSATASTPHVRFTTVSDIVATPAVTSATTFMVSLVATELLYFIAFIESLTPTWRLIEISISHIVSFR
jgi:hypothetical protein